MKKRLDSDTHKMRRESAKFQRWETVEQRKKLVKVLSEKKELKENFKDDLLLDVFEILERSGYGEHSPMHMENYFSNTISISFWYQTERTAKENYENIVWFLKECDFDSIVEWDTYMEFKSKKWGNIKINYKSWNSSILLYWTFTGKAIRKAKDEYRWFSRSREKYEEEENKRYKEEYDQRLNNRNGVWGEEEWEEEE